MKIIKRIARIVFLFFGLVYVALVYFYVVHSLKLDKGFPLGFDSDRHVTQVTFVAKNFPNILWNPYWHSGFVNLPTNYPPLYYIIVGLISRYLHISPADSIRIITLIASFVICAGIFFLAYFLSKRILFAVIAPLLFISTPAFWSYLVEYGFHTKIIGFSFYIIFTILALVYFLIKDTSSRKIKLEHFIYPFVIVSFIAGILTHFLITLCAVITIIALSLIFLHKRKKFTFLLKLGLIISGLSAWYFFPYIIYRFDSVPLIGKYVQDESFSPVSFNTLFRQEYPGLSVILLPFSFILLTLITFTKEGEENKNKHEIKLKLCFYLFAVLALLSVLYSIGSLPFYFSGVYPKHLLFLAGLFLTLTIVLGVSLFGKYAFSTYIMIVIIAVLTSMNVSLARVLKVRTVNYDPAFMGSLNLPGIDVSKNYTFVHNDEKINGAFNLRHDAFQTGGYFIQGQIEPELYYWFNDVIFNKKKVDVAAAKFFLDWVGGNQLYLGTENSELLKLRPTDQFGADKDFSASGYSFFYKKKTPIFYATDVSPIFIDSDVNEYREIIKNLARKGWSVETIIPLRSNNKKVERVDYFEELQKFVQKPVDAETKLAIKNSGDRLRTRYINPQHFEVRLDDRYKGLVFKQSYFQDWNARLIDSGGKKRNLPIYSAGPGMMYVFLPEFHPPGRVVFQYYPSWPELLGYGITAGTLVLIILTQLAKIWSYLYYLSGVHSTTLKVRAKLIKK